jgi:hypothetical protein
MIIIKTVVVAIMIMIIIMTMMVVVVIMIMIIIMTMTMIMMIIIIMTLIYYRFCPCLLQRKQNVLTYASNPLEIKVLPTSKNTSPEQKVTKRLHSCRVIFINPLRNLP